MSETSPQKKLKSESNQKDTTIENGKGLNETKNNNDKNDSNAAKLKSRSIGNYILGNSKMSLLQYKTSEKKTSQCF